MNIVSKVSDEALHSLAPRPNTVLLVADMSINIFVFDLVILNFIMLDFLRTLSNFSFVWSLVTSLQRHRPPFQPPAKG